MNLQEIKSIRLSCTLAIINMILLLIGNLVADLSQLHVKLTMSMLIITAIFSLVNVIDKCQKYIK
jgi:hypothetical protein